MKHNAEKIQIFGKKAVIKQNMFGVWQFRMWISSEKKYIEVKLAEELYIKLRNELANGKTLFAPTYEEAMQQLPLLFFCLLDAFIPSPSHKYL